MGYQLEPTPRPRPLETYGVQLGALRTGTLVVVFASIAVLKSLVNAFVVSWIFWEFFLNLFPFLNFFLYIYFFCFFLFFSSSKGLDTPGSGWEGI